MQSGVLGYVQVEPKRHIENWGQMNAVELNELPRIIQTLETILKLEVDADRVYSVSINEAVRHLHFHIIPRTRVSSTKGLALIEQTTQQKNETIIPFTESELQELTSKIAIALGKEIKIISPTLE